MGLVIWLGRGHSNQSKPSGVGWVSTHHALCKRLRMIQNSLHYVWHRTLRDTGLRSLHNKLRYGADAPIPNERLWIKPALVTHRYRRPNRTDQQIGSRYSGAVMAGDWDLDKRKLRLSAKYRACLRHFKKDLSWEDTGIYDFSMRRIARDGQIDGLTTLADVKARYKAIDDIMATIKSEGQLRNADPSPKYERNGILIHIDREGQPLFGNEGFHRIALSRLANLAIIPVRLGVIHPSALQTDVLQRLRQPPKT